MTKKADVAEHLKAFGHVGLFVNEPSKALSLVVRRRQIFIGASELFSTLP